MKTIGLIGGMSWESSLEYYRLINKMTMNELGAPHSAKILMDSFDFAEVEQLQHNNQWDALTAMMVNSALKLQTAGAQLLVICTNTMHKMAPEVQAAIQIPLLHIADATAHAIVEQKMQKVALLGTKFTMEGDFYTRKIENEYHVEVIIPNKEQREIVHRIIYTELVAGILHDDSRKQYQEIILDLKQRGAHGVILGCTEIPLLIKPEDSCLPVFDTTYIHAQKAVKESLRV